MPDYPQDIHVLHWEVLQVCKREGVEIFDFLRRVLNLNVARLFRYIDFGFTLTLGYFSAIIHDQVTSVRSLPHLDIISDTGMRVLTLQV